MSICSLLIPRALSALVCVVASLATFTYVTAAENEQNTAPASEHKMVEVSELAISARSIDFGSVASGEAQSAIVVLTNTGAPESGSIVIENLFLDELDEQHYKLSANGPITLDPSESFDLLISFEPEEPGLKPGRLIVNHSGRSGVDIIDLNGEGMDADTPLIFAANPISLPFGKSLLGGFQGGKPTSLQFGPDGRLYVAFMDGDIHVMDIERKGANDYEVTDTDKILLVKNIPNHDDDGSKKPTLNKRLVTGLLVTGSAAKPVIYVHSSDPRIGGGSSGNTTGLDTNSGVLSRLTKTSSGWNKLDLVRGLPRSEENHHSNGMALVGSTLYLAAGGNTNMGAISNNFAMLPEYALSAAILSVDLEQIGESTYDLPTLDDEERTGQKDMNDPFGGNAGKNQAMLVENGPVQVYSPGFRNPYDVVVMQNGKMYSWDNGPNSGWGGAPTSCSNARKEPGVTQHDALHLISGPGYYAGHPNPTRGSQKNKFNKKNPQSPVPYANPIECNYYGPGTNGNGKHFKNKALTTLPRSTVGLAEYTASNLSGAIDGNLLAVSWDNKVHRVSFTSSGQLKDTHVLFSNVGVSPLDITAQSDNAVFPGTIWVADFQQQEIVVYEPDDYEGGGAGHGGGGCVAGNNDGDADNDGFTNADELINGTDGCSGADVPADVDGDLISDLLDTDDDNDNIPDVNDPFAIDPSNGATASLPLEYLWENDSESPGFIANLGFTGLMTNGVDSYNSQYDLNEMTIIGAAGVVTVDSVPNGDPLRSKNNQQYGFQFGVNVGPSSGTFRVQTRVLAPFSGFVPKHHQSMGLFIGTGDQDNYVKLTIKHDVAQMLSEVDSGVYFDQLYTTDFKGADHVDLTLEIDPASAIATALFQVTRDGVPAQEVQFASVDFPPTWLTGDTKLAVGIISTSLGANPFPATWDYMSVKPLEGSVALNEAPVVNTAGVMSAEVGVEALLSATVSDDGLPQNTTSSQWSMLSGPTAVMFANGTKPTTAVTFNEGGSYELQLTASDGEYSTSASLTVNVADEQPSSNNVVYRINAGGPLLPDVDGDWLSDSASAQYYNTGRTWNSNAVMDVSGLGDAAPSALFNSERYDRAEGPDLEWKLPVTPGEYIVRLYFSENYFGAMKVGGRVFDVEVEDQLAAGIDVFASVGANTGMMKSFTVLSDDTLDIRFTRVIQNPAIKGIEVLRAENAATGTGGQSTGTGDSGGTSGGVQDDTPVEDETENTAPSVEAGAEASVSLNDVLNLSGSVTDDGLPVNSTTIAWTMISGPASVSFANSDSPVTTVSFSAAGEYVLRLSASDTVLNTYDDMTVVVEDESVVSSVVYRINAGGPLLADVYGDWSADLGASSLANTGKTYSNSVAINTSATPGIPAKLFQSERWDPKSGASLSWKLPVSPGSYEVRLYFSEIFTGAMSDGKRVFNVDVEGQTLPAVDVYAEAGANTAMVKTLPVNNTDGVINIVFDRVVENPAIKGIEVLAID